MSLWLTLLAACFAISACGDDEKEETMAEKVAGSWQIVSMQFVIIGEDGKETVEDNEHMMQSMEWTFGDDGIQYVTNDGILANDNYSYTISGKNMHLTPLNTETGEQEIDAEITYIANGTMKINYYAYGDKTDYIRYTLMQKK